VAARAIRDRQGSRMMAILKIVGVIALWGIIAFSIVKNDLPHKEYIWIAVEVAIALLLIPVVLNNLKKLTR
jgi:hypothetical protein